jgi:probable HAF family extracellular repeat protein
MTAYHFTTIDDPFTHGTSAIGINSSGQIVGATNQNDSMMINGGFLFSGGMFTTLDGPASASEGVVASGINDAGEIVGYFIDASFTTHGFLYNGGHYTILDAPGASGTSPAAINSSGQIVGSINTGVVNSAKGFLYSNGHYTILDDPLGVTGTEAGGINTSGQIVGTYLDAATKAHGFLYSNGNYTTLDDPLAGPLGTDAIGINDAGQIVGDYFDASGNMHGFLYSNGHYATVDDPLPGTQTTEANGINDAGAIVGFYVDNNGNVHGFLASPITAQLIQSEYLAITRTTIPLDQATTIANAINAGTQTETQFINGLLSQVADTTIPVVAVEGSMYGAVGSSAVITNLVNNFLPGQLAYAMQVGLDLQTFACLETALVFAFANESGSTAFANNFGPSNAAMPATAAGDAAFAAAATNAIFGSAQTANTAPAILGYVHFLEGFFTANGIVGVQTPTADQIIIAARAGAWGEGIAIAEGNNLGPFPGQTTNFLEDAAQGAAIYSAPFSNQPTAAPFQGAATASVATAASHVQVTGVAAPVDHVVM